MWRAFNRCLADAPSLTALAVPARVFELCHARSTASPVGFRKEFHRERMMALLRRVENAAAIERWITNREPDHPEPREHRAAALPVVVPVRRDVKERAREED